MFLALTFFFFYRNLLDCFIVWFCWYEMSTIGTSIDMGFPHSSVGKESACNVGDWVWSLGWEDPLEKEMATQSSIRAWEIPWTEEPGGLQSLGLQRAGHEWATERAHTHTHREENRSVVVMVEGGVEKVTWGIFGGGGRHNILNFGGSCKTVHVCQTSELFPSK